MAEFKTPRALGAFWVRKARESGQNYLIGNIKYRNSEIQMTIVKNPNRRREDQPDYVAYINAVHRRSKK